MDIAQIISTNLTDWMQRTPALDTFKKVSARSGVGFGTVQRAKNGDGNITVEKLAALAAAFGRKPADLLAPPVELQPYSNYPAADASPQPEVREEAYHPLVVRYTTADAATRTLIDIALAGPNDPLPPSLSPALRTIVDMARTAIRAEQEKN